MDHSSSSPDPLFIKAARLKRLMKLADRAIARVDELRGLVEEHERRASGAWFEVCGVDGVTNGLDRQRASDEVDRLSSRLTVAEAVRRRLCGEVTNFRWFDGA